METIKDDGISKDGDFELPPRPPVTAKTNVKFSDIYSSLDELGKGAFGVVRKCERKSDNSIVAAKFIKKTTKTKVEVLNEIRIMNELHHKKLISLYDAFEERRELIVVMELVTGGELFEKVRTIFTHILTLKKVEKSNHRQVHCRNMFITFFWLRRVSLQRK